MQRRRDAENRKSPNGGGRDGTENGVSNMDLCRTQKLLRYDQDEDRDIRTSLRSCHAPLLSPISALRHEIRDNEHDDN